MGASDSLDSILLRTRADDRYFLMGLEGLRYVCKASVGNMQGACGDGSTEDGREHRLMENW